MGQARYCCALLQMRHHHHANYTSAPAGLLSCGKVCFLACISQELLRDKQMAGIGVGARAGGACRSIWAQAWPTRPHRDVCSISTLDSRPNRDKGQITYKVVFLSPLAQALRTARWLSCHGLGTTRKVACSTTVHGTLVSIPLQAFQWSQPRTTRVVSGNILQRDHAPAYVARALLACSCL